MENKSGNDMEQIQRGLEAFLEKELEQTGNQEVSRQSTRTRTQNRKSVQVIGQGRETEREYSPERNHGQSRERYGHGEDGGWERYDREGYHRQERYGHGEDGGWEQYDREEAYESGEQYDPEEVYEQEEMYDWDRKPARHRSYAQEREPYQKRRGSRDRETVSKQGRGGKAQSGRRNASRGTKWVQEEPEMTKKAPTSQRTRKKKRKKKHRLLKFFIAVAILFAVLGVGMYQLVGLVYGKMTYHEVASVTGAPMQEDGVVNVLLIGNDSRENGEDGRSDAMILLSISSRTKTIYMTSLLRDMYVDIPGHDGNRLNAAYSFGGAELLMETIEKNFDISVNRYVLVNFEAFAGLVDAVDGIELELTSEEIEYVNGYLVEYNMLTDRPQGTDNMDPSVSGLVHLNGPQALAYSRNRYLGTDFGRTDRQRKVLTAVIKKLPSAMLTNAGGLMEGLLPNLTTNLTQGECFRLSLMAGKMLTYDIVSDSIPQPETYRDVTIRKMSVLEVDFDANIRYLKEKLYGE